tara:strand:+ start:494 stop:970 length:477 start_codon:yes stop_codon:yes gene_type:complete
MNLVCKSKESNDKRNTPIDAWEDILQFIDKKEKLWLPFYNDGGCKKILNDLSYNNVVHINKDFFTYDISDGLVIDNPPYSIKEKIIKKLYTGRRFSLLLPLVTMERKYMKKYLDGFQLVIPSYRYNYIGKKGQCPFKSCWFCWNLQKELKTEDKIIWL